MAAVAPSVRCSPSPRRSSVVEAIRVAVIGSAAMIALLFAWSAFLFVVGPKGVSVNVPPTSGPVGFEAFIADLPDGPRAMKVLDAGCMGPSRHAPDVAVGSYPAMPGTRSSEGVVDVVWIDADRYGLLRKTGPDAWTLRWYPRSAITRTKHSLDFDDVEIDSAAGVDAAAPSVEWLRTIGLAKALEWRPTQR